MSRCCLQCYEAILREGIFDNDRQQQTTVIRNKPRLDDAERVNHTAGKYKIKLLCAVATRSENYASSGRGSAIDQNEFALHGTRELKLKRDTDGAR